MRAERRATEWRKVSIRAHPRWLGRMGLPLALLAAMVMLPVALPYEALATQVLVFALFSLGFDLVYGHAGLLSFGHAAFFGLGAYGAGLAGLATHGNVALALVVAAAGAGTGAVVIGFFSLRRRGVYFALLTLAFAQLLYFVALQWRTLTGGDDGLRGLPVMGLRAGGTVLLDLASSRTIYVFTAAIVGISVLLMRRLHESPFGRALVAVRENELRAEACGYNTSALKLWAFTLSGILCGVAGGLNTVLLKFVGLDILSWLTSGFVVLMTILGGTGTLVGPPLGALVFVALQDIVSTVPAIADSWPLVVGILFIVAVLLFPGGLWGTILHVFEQRRGHKRSAHEESMHAGVVLEEGTRVPISAQAASTASGAAVRLEAVTKRFGALSAVGGVSLDVRPGEVRGIIGPNGAGKTTLLRLISGEMSPTSGRIFADDREITAWPLHRVARSGIVKSFQVTSVFPNLTAFENVRVAILARRAPFDFWQRADELWDVTGLVDAVLRRVHLVESRGHPAYALSHGEQRHLEVAIALAAGPRVLLLDEPTAGMSVEETRKTMELIRDLATDVTIIVVEHKMDVIMAVCDRVTVMYFGDIIAEGTPEEIRTSARVQAVYLGRN